MKFKLIALSATLLLITGCTSKEYRKYDKLCKNLPEGFLNKDLEEAYNKEKGLYIKTDNDSEWMYLSLVRTNKRWDFIEMNLKKNLSYGFPQEDGLFRIYRDYDFNNCIEYVSFDNKHTDVIGEFCLAFQKINHITANVILERHEKKLNANTMLIDLRVKLNNNYFLKTSAAFFSYASGGYGCDGEHYTYIYKDFK